MTNPFILYGLQWVVTFTLGAIMGSFLLVVVQRMRVRTLRGRSRCDACGTQLRARDLVPVLSYVLLRGRCRDCQTRISSLSVWSEVVMGCLFAVHSFVASDVTTLVVGYIVLSLCYVMAVYDARSYFLPNVFLWTLVGVGAAYRLFSVDQMGITHSLMGYVYLCIPAGILGAISVVSRGRAMGGGDPLLLLGLSLVVGTWQGALLTLLFASWIGLLYVVVVSLYQHWQGRFTLDSLSGKPIAFGPCLIAGFICSWWLSLSGFIIFV